jgi:Thermostable hemolysin
MRVQLTPRNDRLRPAAERLIADAYAQHYGARITSFPELLVSMVQDDGAVRCAAGLRFAEDGFFSEIYLDAPIEEVLSALRDGAVRREKVLEVTSLASRAPLLVGGFLRKIIACGQAAGFEWAFFTATAPLKSLLDRMQLVILPIADASPLQVANPQTWGTYYAFAPRVYALHRDTIGLCRGRVAGAVAYG